MRSFFGALVYFRPMYQNWIQALTKDNDGSKESGPMVFRAMWLAIFSMESSLERRRHRQRRTVRQSGSMGSWEQAPPFSGSSASNEQSAQIASSAKTTSSEPETRFTHLVRDMKLLSSEVSLHSSSQHFCSNIIHVCTQSRELYKSQRAID